MLNDDVNQLERFLNTGFNELVQLGVLFVFAFAVMFPISWQLSLVAVAPIPVILWGSLLYQRRIQPRYRRVREGVGGPAWPSWPVSPGCCWSRPTTLTGSRVEESYAAAMRIACKCNRRPKGRRKISFHTW